MAPTGASIPTASGRRERPLRLRAHVAEATLQRRQQRLALMRTQPPERALLQLVAASLAGREQVPPLRRQPLLQHPTVLDVGGADEQPPLLQALQEWGHGLGTDERPSRQLGRGERPWRQLA